MTTLLNSMQTVMKKAVFGSGSKGSKVGSYDYTTDIRQTPIYKRVNANTTGAVGGVPKMPITPIAYRPPPMPQATPAPITPAPTKTIEQGAVNGIATPKTPRFKVVPDAFPSKQTGMTPSISGDQFSIEDFK